MDDQAQEWPSIDIVFDQAQRLIDIQSQIWDQTNSRLSLVIGFIGIILAAAVGLIGQATDLHQAAKGFSVASVIVLLAAGLLTGLAYLPGVFNRPPALEPLLNQYLDQREHHTKHEIVIAMLEAYNENRDKIHQKLRFFNAGFVGFGLGIVFIGAAVITQVIAG